MSGEHWKELMKDPEILAAARVLMDAGMTTQEYDQASRDYEIFKEYGIAEMIAAACPPIGEKL